MVFSSLPPNWHQQQNHQTSSGSGGISSSNTNNNTQPELVQLHNEVVVPPPLPVPVQPHHGGSIRPGSMADRARMANIPMPETALKCPRCESTNTKFCYFNNYSLTQPRHFCKTCRRYWTRGGALRNVPVGGGCRRNKRSSSSKAANKASPAPTSSAEVLGLAHQLPALRFMAAPLHHPALIPDFTAGDMGLNYGPAADLGFHMAPGQFPFLPPDFEGATTSSGITQQMASVKMEDHNNNNQMAGIRHLLGADHHHHHHQYYWNNINNASSATTAWTDLSGFSSSSTTSNQL